MIEKILTLLKNLDFKHIITELKRLRKGAAVLIFFTCLCCGISDYILRKHGLTLDWFTQIYLIVGFLSACVYGVKIFNCIADKVDAQKEQEAQQEEYKKQVIGLYMYAKPILSVMTNKEIAFLKRFVQEGKLVIAECNMQNGMYSNNFLSISNSITAKLFTLGLTIKNDASLTHLFFRIDKIFYDILCMYFNS